MQNTNYFLSQSFDYLFNSYSDKFLVDNLVRYIITGDRPVTTPALWQDVEIYLRFKKRDLWHLSDESINNAEHAILIYCIKYIIEHLSKAEIIKCLQSFYSQKDEANYNPEYQLSPINFFEQKFHAPVDSLFLTQEKLIIDKEQLKDLDKYFAYPCWLEFTDAALDQLFAKIQNGELTDEQISYVLGANDNEKDYHKWFKIAKHILTTTHDPQTFWIAGDVLAIIRRAIPSDEKSQKWLRDQIFEIFWPRVCNIWPLQNQDALLQNANPEIEILLDSAHWLQTLEDLRTRLPELDNNIELYEFDTDPSTYNHYKNTLEIQITNSDSNLQSVVNTFCALTDCATNPETTADLHKVATDKLLPFIQAKGEDVKILTDLINRALKHADNYQKTLARERKNLTTYLINSR